MASARSGVAVPAGSPSAASPVGLAALDRPAVWVRSPVLAGLEPSALDRSLWGRLAVDRAASPGASCPESAAAESPPPEAWVAAGRLPPRPLLRRRRGLGGPSSEAGSPLPGPSTIGGEPAGVLPSFLCCSFNSNPFGRAVSGGPNRRLRTESWTPRTSRDPAGWASSRPARTGLSTNPRRVAREHLSPPLEARRRRSGPAPVPGSGGLPTAARGCVPATVRRCRRGTVAACQAKRRRTRADRHQPGYQRMPRSPAGYTNRRMWTLCSSPIPMRSAMRALPP